MEHISYPHTLTFGAFKKARLGRIPSTAHYRGTIKLHGTNATIIFRNGNVNTVTYQSRNRVITKEDDNQNTVALLSAVGVDALAREVVRVSGKTAFKEIMIAGELGGKGIQKGVAVAEMERFWCVFNIRVDGEWVDMAAYKGVEIPAKRVYNIMNFQTWMVKINLLGETAGVMKQMMKYTAEVGKQCPFAASFGVGGGVKGGEGIVWTMVWEEGYEGKRGELLNFKTKAEAFAVTSSMPKVPWDTAMKERGEKFVGFAVGERRLQQGVEYVKEMNQSVERDNVGLFVKWVCTDTLREEGDAMREMGADEKVVRKLLSDKARGFWFNLCDAGEVFKKMEDMKM